MRDCSAQAPALVRSQSNGCEPVSSVVGGAAPQPQMLASDQDGARKRSADALQCNCTAGYRCFTCPPAKRPCGGLSLPAVDSSRTMSAGLQQSLRCGGRDAHPQLQDTATVAQVLMAERSAISSDSGDGSSPASAPLVAEVSAGATPNIRAVVPSRGEGAPDGLTADPVDLAMDERPQPGRNPTFMSGSADAAPAFQGVPSAGSAAACTAVIGGESVQAVECPMCFKLFGRPAIEEHASQCAGEEDARRAEDDEALARKMQLEENARGSSGLRPPILAAGAAGGRRREVQGAGKAERTRKPHGASGVGAKACLSTTLDRFVSLGSGDARAGSQGWP